MECENAVISNHERHMEFEISEINIILKSIECILYCDFCNYRPIFGF